MVSFDYRIVRGSLRFKSGHRLEVDYGYASSIVYVVKDLLCVSPYLTVLCGKTPDGREWPGMA